MATTIKINDKITPMLIKQTQQISKLPTQALNVFKDNTPIRKGNARRNTKLKSNQIVANYPYAERLDEGYSKQSPQGMVKPTEEYIAEEFIKIMTGKK